MNEIARFQRLSSVSSRAIGLPGCGRAAVDVICTPGEAVETGVAESFRHALEEPRWVDAVVVGERDQLRLDVREAGVACAREARLRALVHELGAAPATISATRSSAFWSTTITRTRSYPCASTESRKRSSSSVRPTVATTRSNDGSSRDTGRRLRDVAVTAPLVTALLAVHDGEAYVRPRSRASSARPSPDLELVVVDDASTDATPEILASIGDARLRVLRNDAQLGLAGSLNRGLDEARGHVRRTPRRRRRGDAASARATARPHPRRAAGA